MAELCKNLIHNSYATNVDNQQISIGILSPEATVHLMFDCPISRKGDNQCWGKCEGKTEWNGALEVCDELWIKWE